MTFAGSRYELINSDREEGDLCDGVCWARISHSVLALSIAI